MSQTDTLLLFGCTLLVWLMTPGLALFYGGLVQSKNVLNTSMHSISAIVVVTFTWVLIGFSISFGGNNLWIGDFSHALLNGVDSHLMVILVKPFHSHYLCFSN